MRKASSPSPTSSSTTLYSSSSSSSSSSDSNDDDDDKNNNNTDNNDIVADRKKRLNVGYQTISLMYGLAGIFHILKKGTAFWSLYYAMGGPFLACGVANILNKAVAENRLSSTTYKRMNLFLGIFGLLGLSLPIIDPDHFTTLSFILPPLVTTINSIKGYGYGVLGIDYDYKSNTKKSTLGLLAEDFKQVIKSTIQGIFDFKKKSLDYNLAFGFVTGMALIKLKECLSLMILGFETSSNFSPALMLASRISRFARLTLLTGVMYTLKDGADNNLLSKSTYLTLNYLSSGVFFTMAGYLCPSNKPTILGCTALLFSFIMGYNGYTKSKVAAASKLKQPED